MGPDPHLLPQIQRSTPQPSSPRPRSRSQSSSLRPSGPDASHPPSGTGSPRHSALASLLGPCPSQITFASNCTTPGFPGSLGLVPPPALRRRPLLGGPFKRNPTSAAGTCSPAALASPWFPVLTPPTPRGPFSSRLLLEAASRTARQE